MEVYKEFTVASKEGIHARPAASLVKLANAYSGEILIHYGNRVIDAKSIMSILAAGIGFGATITVSVAGDGAPAVLAEVVELLGESKAS